MAHYESDEDSDSIINEFGVEPNDEEDNIYEGLEDLDPRELNFMLQAPRPECDHKWLLGKGLDSQPCSFPDKQKRAKCDICDKECCIMCIKKHLGIDLEATRPIKENSRTKAEYELEIEKLKLENEKQKLEIERLKFTIERLMWEKDRGKGKNIIVV